MGTKLFHKAVRIQIGRVDRDRIVVGTKDAAKILLHDWPTTDNPKRVAAMKACLELINGRKPPLVARAAFVAAAKDAGVYLGGYERS